MHQPREPCEMYPYFSPKLCNLPCELLYLRLKTAPDDGVCWHTNRPKDVDFQKMKKRCEKLSFRAKIEKWEQRYGGKQLRRMNKEAQNVKYLKIAGDFSLALALRSRSLAHRASRKIQVRRERKTLLPFLSFLVVCRSTATHGGGARWCTIF